MSNYLTSLKAATAASGLQFAGPVVVGFLGSPQPNRDGVMEYYLGVYDESNQGEPRGVGVVAVNAAMYAAAGSPQKGSLVKLAGSYNMKQDGSGGYLRAEKMAPYTGAPPPWAAAVQAAQQGGGKGGWKKGGGGGRKDWQPRGGAPRLDGDGVVEYLGSLFRLSLGSIHNAVDHEFNTPDWTAAMIAAAISEAASNARTVAMGVEKGAYYATGLEPAPGAPAVAQPEKKEPPVKDYGDAQEPPWADDDDESIPF